jgi:hypothetical protein
MNFGVKSSSGAAEELRDKYERSGKAVDAELRRALPPPPPMPILNEEQARVVQRCLALETGSAAVEWTKLKSISPFVELAMKYTKPVSNEPRCDPPLPPPRPRERSESKKELAAAARQRPTPTTGARSCNSNQRSRGAPTTDARAAHQYPTLARSANN